MSYFSLKPTQSYWLSVKQKGRAGPQNVTENYNRPRVKQSFYFSKNRGACRMTIKNNFSFFLPWLVVVGGATCCVMCRLLLCAGPAKMEFSFSPLVSCRFFFRLVTNSCPLAASASLLEFLASFDTFGRKNRFPSVNRSVPFFSFFLVNSNQLRLLKNDEISFFSVCVCVCRATDWSQCWLSPSSLSLSSLRSVVMATSYNPLPLPPQHARYTQCLVELRVWRLAKLSRTQNRQVELMIKWKMLIPMKIYLISFSPNDY
jgi:hypothetical protein